MRLFKCLLTPPASSDIQAPCCRFAPVWLFLLLVIAFSPRSFAVGEPALPIFDVIDKTKGYAGGASYGVVTDQNGLVWIASEKGLFYYDGVTARRYNLPETAESVFPDLADITLDGDILWIGFHDSSLGRLNISDGAFAMVRIVDTPDDSILGLAALENSIVVGCSGGLFVIDKTSMEVTKVELPTRYGDYPQSSFVREVVTDGHSIFAFVESGETTDGSGREYGFIATLNDQFKVVNWQVPRIDFAPWHARYHQGRLYVGTSNEGAQVFDASSLALVESYKSPRLPTDVVLDVLPMGGDLWLATVHAGLIRIKASGEVVVYDPQKGYPFSTGPMELNTLNSDSSGLIWISNYQAAVSVVNTNNLDVIEYRRLLPNATPVRAITRLNGKVYLGTGNDGLVVVETDGTLSRLKFSQVTHNPADDSVSALGVLKNSVLVGTLGGALWQVEADNSFSKFSTDSRLQRYVTYGISVGEGYAFFETDLQAGFVTDTDGNVLDRQLSSEYTGDRVGLARTRDSDEWIDAWTSGVEAGEQWVQSLIVDCGSTQVFDMKTQGQSLLIADQSGVCDIDLDHRISRRILASNVLMEEVIPVGSRFVATMTDTELLVYDREISRTVVLNGLSGWSEFNHGNWSNISAAPDGKSLLVGVDGGYASIDLSLVRERKVNRELIFTNLTTDGWVAHGGFWSEGGIELSPGHKVVTVSTVAPAILTEPLSLTMSIDGGPHIDLNGNVATLPIAQYGSHEILFGGKSRHADFQTFENSLDYVVLRPWWATYYAFAGYALAGVLLLYLVSWYRLRNEREQSRKLQFLIEERTMEIKQLLAEKEEMFEEISHELRTPLTIILGQSEVLLRADKSNDTIASVHRQATKLNDLIGRMLRLVELKAVVSDDVATNVADEIAKVVEQNAYLARSRGLSFRVNLQALPDVRLILKRDTVDLALGNLIGNAIKYASAPSVIEIEAGVEGNLVYIRVSNVGELVQGFRQAKERYARGDSKVAQGFGIGLAIVEKIVSLNDGRFSMRNTDDGRVLAELQLPLVQVNSEVRELPAGEPERAPVAAVPINGERVSVLVVEDDEELNAFLVSLLSDQFNVLSAMSAELGWELLQENDSVELVISDVMLPGMNGMEFCLRLKSSEDFSQLPVLLLTAKADHQSKLKGLESRADDYITKPFSAEALLLKISNILRTREAQRRAYYEEFVSAAGSDVPTGNSTVERGRPTLRSDFEIKLMAVLERHYGDSDLATSDFAAFMHISERTLSRKVKDLFDKSFSVLLRDYRLEKARKQLAEGSQIQEAAFACGFGSPAYFSKCYREKFGKTPSADVG